MRSIFIDAIMADSTTVNKGRHQGEKAKEKHVISKYENILRIFETIIYSVSSVLKLSFWDLPTGFGTYAEQDVHAKPSSEACSTSSSVYKLSQTAWTQLHRHTDIHNFS